MSERYFSNDLKRRVLAENNIVDVVQDAVGKLTRAGRNYKACCPFHNEKTPSFNVNAEGQYFKCFGCGKGGDVITFVMLHERVEFMEAFRILADRANITIETDPRAAEQYRKESDFKSYLYRFNEVAALFYREQLTSDAGKAAREYLKKRGLTDEICERFRIGYAPAGGSPLLNRLTNVHRAPLKAVLAAGLASERENGSMRDFFFDRVIFPICNMDGRVIAFGGRIMGLGEPKYLNTRDTLLFNKSGTVYGLDHARDEIRSTKTAIIVEGYTDVMMCHQFGVTNVVACLGTAITSEHIRQLRRVADELLILTDSDAAGAKASERSLAVLFQEEAKAKIARLPGADKDPCDFLLANGVEPFREALKTPQELFDYKFAAVLKKHDISAPLGLKNAVTELMSLISLVPDSLLKNRYRYEVLKRLNVDERDLQYEATRSQVTSIESPVAVPDVGNEPPPESQLAVSEREILRFLFHEPAFFDQLIAHVDLAGLSGAPERMIGRAILEAIEAGTLPPDADVLTESSAGSIVAREVIQRLQNVADDGIVAAEGAQAVCVALAETPPKTSKLAHDQRLQILIKEYLTEKLSIQARLANLRCTQAKLNRNADEERVAYEEMVAVRKEMARLKSKQPKE